MQLPSLLTLSYSCLTISYIRMCPKPLYLHEHQIPIPA